MKKYFFLLILALFISIPGCLQGKSELDSILSVLDKTIENKEIYIRKREERIAELKKLLTSLQNPTFEQEYDIYYRLFYEYKPFNIDSTIAYAEKNVLLATKAENLHKLYESQLNLTIAYSLSGFFNDAFKLIESIPTVGLSDWLKEKYYDSYKQLLYYYPSNTVYRNKYISIRDSLLVQQQHDSNSYNTLYAEILIEQGKTEEARCLVYEMFEKEENSHFKAVLAYNMGETYRVDGNYEMQKIYYAISANYDVQNAIRENASFRALALAFYETGDLTRAYKYIQQSLSDAISSNSGMRTMEVSHIFPIIENSYQKQTQAQKSRLSILLISVALLSLLLIITIIYVYRQMKKLAVARKLLYQNNLQLKQLNEDLIKNNKELSESNILKEEYIARYMEQSSAYLDKMESYRKLLNRIASGGKLEDLYKTIKSKQFIDDELKEFYSNFDNSFLQLFPNFIEDFNALLCEEEKVQPKPKEILNTELRIYALIRLGITDSNKIAQFLRYPVNTIYSYRARTRNKASGIRDEFEENVIKIGMISEKNKV